MEEKLCVSLWYGAPMALVAPALSPGWLVQECMWQVLLDRALCSDITVPKEGGLLCFLTSLPCSGRP